MSEKMDSLWEEFDQINDEIRTVTARKLSRPITLNIWGQPNGAYKKADSADQALLDNLAKDLAAVEAEIAVQEEIEEMIETARIEGSNSERQDMIRAALEVDPDILSKAAAKGNRAVGALRRVATTREKLDEQERVANIELGAAEKFGYDREV